jgi:WXG100 family type VII secretion target
MLDRTATEVESAADEYKNEYNRLFGTVQGMSQVWSGTDNVAFTNQIEGFRGDFQRMEALMRDYAAFLRRTAAAYRQQQEQTASAARNLSQGS